MSLGDRLQQLAVRGCLIAGVVLLTAGVGPCEGQEDHQKGQQTTEQGAEPKPPEPPPVIVADADDDGQASKIYQATCYQADKERLIIDECQQWRMAKAADLQAGITRDLYTLTAVEVGLLVPALIASLVAAVASIYTVFVARELAHKELRAYMTVQSFDIQETEGSDKELFVVTLSNTGATPARAGRENLDRALSGFPA